MGTGQREKFDNSVIDWIDQRLPIFTLLDKEYGKFPVPKNFNYFWNFGAIAMFMLVTMILTGLFLTMHYVPHEDHAFNSVERIMRDVNQGWLIRYLHLNGASFFFIAIYIHMFRGMYYGSFKKPRELMWILGVVILFLMMATAFMGYTLPWSQMSGWGAKVITGFVTAIPFIGDTLHTWLLGGFTVDNPTLKRFYSLHFLLPFVIVGVVFLHVWALHISGSNNPTGIEPKSKQDTIPFHPYYTMKDIFGLTVFLLLFLVVTFFYPTSLTHADHFVEFQPLVTPPHIVPEWYFLPFYAILRAWTFDIPIPFTDVPLITAKLGGVILLFGSVAILFFLPWLDTHPVRSARYRPLYKFALFGLLIAVVALGYVGAKPVEQPYVAIGQIATLYYFAYFLVILPLLSRHEKARPMPNSIHEAVLEKRQGKPAKRPGTLSPEPAE